MAKKVVEKSVDRYVLKTMHRFTKLILWLAYSFKLENFFRPKFEVVEKDLVGRVGIMHFYPSNLLPPSDGLKIVLEAEWLWLENEDEDWQILIGPNMQVYAQNIDTRRVMDITGEFKVVPVSWWVKFAHGEERTVSFPVQGEHVHEFQDEDFYLPLVSHMAVDAGTKELGWNLFDWTKKTDKNGITTLFASKGDTNYYRVSVVAETDQLVLVDINSGEIIKVFDAKAFR